MPANIGEMFYTGAIPWHKEGVALAQPATLVEALKVGGLDWQVGEVDMLTADDPPSPIEKRKAIVRLDRPAGHERRVLGVAHRGFAPVQNTDAGLLLDSIFGEGKRVYHTGGYLGAGEVVWLLARIDRPIRIVGDDVVEPYALMANSHDGSRAFTISLTTVRVVCQNTLSLALNEKLGKRFRRAHQGSFADHAIAAQEFLSATLKQWDAVGQSFVHLSTRPCSNEAFSTILVRLLPDPPKPRHADRNPRVLHGWHQRVTEIREARAKIVELRGTGRGLELPGAAGTFWGALNAVIEYVDHHRQVKGSPIAYALLGDGMDLKARAFTQIQEAAKVA